MSVDFIRSHHTALFNYFPDDSIYCRFGSYILDLSQSEEALLSNIHSKHRNVIKKAKKDNVLISCGKENRDKCEFLINSTLSRQKVHQINQNMLNKLTALSNIDYWIAEYNDEIHGAAIIVWAENSAYYLYGGSIEKTHSGAMNLLHWAAIMEMKKRNVKFYDFVGARIDPEEGSKYEGIQRFKSRFGGELKQGYLWKLPLNKVKYKLYVSMQKLKNYGQFKGDIIDQERRRGMI
jgi:lipid II:glycine glycyltransferase (peptidoglycan interpeptide bridge formation enzyme)